MNWHWKYLQFDKVQDTKPITYLLKDENNEEIKGCFYRQELQKVDLHTWLLSYKWLTL